MLVAPASHPDRNQEIDKIASLVNSAYRGQSAEQGWASEARMLAGQRIDSAMLTAMLSGGKATILLLRDREGGPLAGCVTLEPTEEASAWHLSMLTIDPKRQAEGLGRLLLSKAEEHLRARGATRVEIAVIWLREGLIEWYERRGYRRTGQTKPFPYGDQRFGLPLRDDLYFVVMDKSLA